jgi:hypothetical protein
VLFIGGENVASNYPCHSQTILRIFWVHNRGRIQNRRLTRWDGGALAPTVSAIKLITGSVLSGLNGFLLLPGHTHPRQRLPAESEHFPLWQDHPYKAHISSILFFPASPPPLQSTEARMLRWQAQPSYGVLTVSRSTKWTDLGRILSVGWKHSLSRLYIPMSPQDR